MYLFRDHRSILFRWSRRGELSQRFFKHHVVHTKFQNLNIIKTEGNLTFPDLPSQQQDEVKKLNIKQLPNS